MLLLFWFSRLSHGFYRYTRCSLALSNVLRASGLRYFSTALTKRELEVVIISILIFICHRGSVAFKYLLMTYRFFVVLLSRLAFALRLDELTSAIPYRVVPKSTFNYALSGRTPTWSFWAYSSFKRLSVRFVRSAIQ